MYSLSVLQCYSMFKTTCYDFYMQYSLYIAVIHSHRSQNSKSERKRKRFSDSERLFSRSSVTSHTVSELIA